MFAKKKCIRRVLSRFTPQKDTNIMAGVNPIHDEFRQLLMKPVVYGPRVLRPTSHYGRIVNINFKTRVFPPLCKDHLAYTPGEPGNGCSGQV